VCVFNFSNKEIHTFIFYIDSLGLFSECYRQVWRYQSGNQKPKIEQGYVSP